MRALSAKLFFLSLPVLLKASTLQVPDQLLNSVAQKIFKNECSLSVRALTSWNEGEGFASCGIGHFIWFPQNFEGMFEETFPELVSFFQKHHKELPEVLQKHAACPWSSREEFYKQFHCEDMKELRQFLSQTIDLQAKYILSKLDKRLDLILESVTIQEKQKIEELVEKLSKTTQGLYALLDYHNFKGSGLSPKETYLGQGWGLKDVLLDMNEKSLDLVSEFAACAKKRLILRVENSPKERGEKRWLKGWIKRIDSYLSY